MSEVPPPTVPPTLHRFAKLLVRILIVLMVAAMLHLFSYWMLFRAIFDGAEGHQVARALSMLLGVVARPFQPPERQPCA